MDVASGYCPSRGIETIELQVEENNEKAQAFYLRLGFTELVRAAAIPWASGLLPFHGTGGVKRFDEVS